MIVDLQTNSITQKYIKSTALPNTTTWRRWNSSTEGQYRYSFSSDVTKPKTLLPPPTEPRWSQSWTELPALPASALSGRGFSFCRPPPPMGNCIIFHPCPSIRFPATTKKTANPRLRCDRTRLKTVRTEIDSPGRFSAQKNYPRRRFFGAVNGCKMEIFMSEIANDWITEIGFSKRLYSFSLRFCRLISVPGSG